ncbi:MAG: hypothetical protein CVU77_07855 [Elusimicrobia bacterium HGW-Elusimicrobia-1]|nr:MAG: hypothetical protein CVU77_07855 [Elusimicrobia bacterium HGW-Elusimicrobia-1]
MERLAPGLDAGAARDFRRVPFLFAPLPRQGGTTGITRYLFPRPRINEAEGRESGSSSPPRFSRDLSREKRDGATRRRAASRYL